MTRVFSCLLIAATACAQSLFPNGLARFAGADFSNYTGDGGPAYYGAFSLPRAVTRDSTGNLYVAESSRIRKIDANGIVSTLASNVNAWVIAVDPAGNVYFSDLRTIQRLGSVGAPPTTVAGNGTASYNGEGVPALSASMAPAGLAIDASGQVYFSDANPNFRLRVLRLDGKIYTVAGTGQAGMSGENGPAAQAQLSNPAGLGFDGAGNLYIADSTRLLKIDSSGLLTRYAGTGLANGAILPGKPAIESSLKAIGVAADAAGNVFIAGGPVFKITPDGTLNSFAGDSPAPHPCGNALGTSVYATSVAADAAGNAYFLTSGLLDQATPGGQLITIAGMGPNLFTGDGGLAASATFARPTGIAFDGSGRMYIADTNNNRIRRVDKNGVVTTVAGAGGATYDQDAACLPDNASILNHPRSVTVDAAGNLYIADTGKGRVRKIAPDGTASDIVPAATKWFDAPISQPIGVAVDESGNIWVADADSSRVVEIGPNGAAIQSVSVAATGQIAFDALGNLLIPTTSPYNGGVVYLLPSSPSAPGNAALLAAASTSTQASGSAADASGSIYVSDSAASILTRTSASCAIASDGSLQLSKPAGLAFGPTGDLYISDIGNNSIWMAAPKPAPANEAPTPRLNQTLPITNAAPAAPPLAFEPVPGGYTFPQEPAAPGELIHINGACIGPVNPVFASFDANGNLPMALSGVSVTMNGLQLPLLSSSENMVVAQVPWEAAPVDAPASNVQLTYQGVTSTSLAPVAYPYPALFTMNGQPGGQAIGVNQDGTINSAANPAPKGSVVTLWGSGFGPVTPSAGTGKLAPANPLQQLMYPPAIYISMGTPPIGNVVQQAVVKFAGNAPGLVGVTQLNVQIPLSSPGGEVLVSITPRGQNQPDAGAVLYIQFSMD